MVHELGQAILDFSCTWMLSVIREQGLHVERCHAERGNPRNSGVLCVYSLPFPPRLCLLPILATCPGSCFSPVSNILSPIPWL